MADVSPSPQTQAYIWNGTSFVPAKDLAALDAAPNSQSGVLAAGIGPGFDLKYNPTNLATALNSVITNTVDGAEWAFYAIGTGTTGTFTFEVSYDDTNWSAATFYNALTGASASGNITPTANTVYVVDCGGARQVRIRVVTALGATVAVKQTFTLTTFTPSGGGSAVTATGNVASGAADSGNPVKVGGVYNSAPGVQSTGNRVDLQTDSRGSLKVALKDIDGLTSPNITALSSDGLSATNNGLISIAANAAYNGTTWDRLRTLGQYDAAAATPPVGILAVIAPDRRYSAVSLGTAANSTQTWDLGGADTAVVYCGTSTTGTYIFEVTIDGTNWVSAETYNGTDELWVSGVNLTPTSGKGFRIMTSGFRTLRVRTVTSLGATVSFTANIAADLSIVRAVEVGNSPHMIGQTWINKVAQYTTTQTGTALWTPASGKRIVVTALQIQAGGTTAGTVQVWYGASGDTTYTRGTDYAIFDGEFAPSSTLKPGVIMMPGVFVADAADRVLRVTDSAAINPLTVNAWGYETL